MLYNRKDWMQFLDNSKELLVETDDMFAKSKEDYRVKKLVVFYCLRDKETFEEYLETELGRKYLGIARYVLETILAHDFYGYEENCEVAKALSDKYFADSNLKRIYNPEFIEGYYKFLSEYTGQRIWEEKNIEVKVDLDKLEIK